MNITKADDIAGLLHQKKLAIENLDFNLAESLHFQIIEETDRMANDNFSLMITNHENEIRTLLINFDKEVSALMKLNEDSKIKIEDDFNSRANAKNEEVKNEILKLNDLIGTEESHDYDDDIVQLQENARIEATKANFNNARKLKEEADLLIKARNLSSKQHLAEELQKSKEQLQEAKDGFIMELAKERIRKEREVLLRHQKSIDSIKRSTSDQLRIVHMKVSAEVAALSASDSAHKLFTSRLDHLYNNSLAHIQSVQYSQSNEDKPSMKKEMLTQTKNDETFVTRSTPISIRTSRPSHPQPKSRFF